MLTSFPSLYSVTVTFGAYPSSRAGPEPIVLLVNVPTHFPPTSRSARTGAAGRGTPMSPGAYWPLRIGSSRCLPSTTFTCVIGYAIGWSYTARSSTAPSPSVSTSTLTSRPFSYAAK